jgi:ATP-dependent phosphoenolpyruvate carboxykinase
VPEVPRRILDPRSSWLSPEDYDRQAAKLKGMYDQYFRDFREMGAAAG